MREHLKFLEISSMAVKIAAWAFFILGVMGGLSIMRGLVPAQPRWTGIIVLALYAFFFFFFFLVAKMADLLVNIINEIKKE